MKTWTTHLLILATLATAGCSGGGGSGAAPSAVAGGGGVPPAPVPSPVPPLPAGRTNASGVFSAIVGGRPLLGTVLVEAAEAGATVELVRQEQRLEITLQNGAVLLADLDLVQVDLESRQDPGAPPPPVSPAGAPLWIWVNPVSHLVALYRDAYPEATGAQAVTRVKRYLGLDPQSSVNRTFGSNRYSNFSPRAFVAAARASGGWNAFCPTLLADIHAGRQRFFREGTPANVPARGDVTVLEGEEAGKLLTKAMKKTLCKVLGRTITSVGINQTLTNTCPYIGSKKATKEGLQAIVTFLDGLLGEISNLRGNVQQLGVLALANTLEDGAARADVFTEQELLAVGTAAQSPSYVPNQPGQTPSFLTPLLAAVDVDFAESYARQVLDATLGLAGQGNLIQGYQQVVARGYGRNNNPAYNFYEFRSDSLTPRLQDASNYYLGVLFQAINMFAESSKAGMASPVNPSSPASLMNLVGGFLNGTGLTQKVGGTSGTNGFMALVARMAQQTPTRYLGGEDPLASSVHAWTLATAPVAGTSGLANGTLFYAPGIEIKQEGSNSGVGIQATVDAAAVGNYYGFYLPSVADVRTLCQTHAKAVATQDGVTSQNAIPYGLHKMGLLSDANYSTDMTNVKIYCVEVPGSPKGGDDFWDLTVYSTIDDSSGGDGDNVVNNVSVFRPQGSASFDTSVVLLVRPFPGQPQNMPFTWTNLNQDVPQAVLASQTYATVHGKVTPNTWCNRSDAALAAGFPPQEIVIQQDPGDPRQLRAYALWEVDLSGYDHKSYPHAGGLAETAYVMYWDVTEDVEWLSSDTTAAEVTNFAYDPSDPSADGVAGRLLVHAGSGEVTVTASWQKQPSTTAATNSTGSTASFVKATKVLGPLGPLQDVAVNQLLVTPDNFPLLLSGAGTTCRFFLTGGRNDGIWVNLTAQCTWQAFLSDGATPLPASVAEFDPVVAGMLKFKAGGLSQNTQIVVRATRPDGSSAEARFMALAP